MPRKTAEIKDVCRIIEIDGARLEVIASNSGFGEWSLAVRNELGVCSNWFETFISAEAAIDAGVKAIKTEGVSEFVSVEGFEYLLS